jgi:ABC-2 type transport system permease protein
VNSSSSEHSLKTAIPPLPKTLLSLLAADFAVLLRHRQSLVLGLVLPLIILIGGTQSSGDFANRFGGSAVPLGSSITIGMMSTALLGYSIATARDRERGIFQRLRVTPAPTWTIMVSRLTVQVIASLLMLVVILLADYLLNNVSLGIGEYLLTLLLTVVGAAVFLRTCLGMPGYVAKVSGHGGVDSVRVRLGSVITARTTRRRSLALHRPA